MQIEFMQYAPDYIVSVANETVNELKMHQVVDCEFKAYAMFQMFFNVSEEYKSLRDRTEEMSLAVMGMANKKSYTELVVKGSDLFKDHGYPAVGAQFAQTFKIIFA
jgi:hypothetical protein